ncbi:MAG: response regulator [Nitriliruptorales bacterium]
MLPDAVVLDVDMPHTDGISAIAGIAAVAPTTRIVMFSAFTDRREEAMTAGAHAWVGKGESWAVLRAAILGRAPAAA